MSRSRHESGFPCAGDFIVLLEMIALIVLYQRGLESLKI